MPVQQRAFVSRFVCDASGEPRRADVLVDGEWLHLEDALELEVLESCADGQASVKQLSAELAQETDGAVTQSDVVDRLRHLYQMRLVSFA